MNYFYMIAPGLFILILLIFIITFHFKKKSAIRKVSSLNAFTKNSLLNSLIEPAGYAYSPCQDIFTTRLDASQKSFGYISFYDSFAAYFNMIFDYETFYFNYDSRTWLIEIWKGQYGINSGCEVGVYYTDTIISPDKYSSTLFKAVEPQDMPGLSVKLNSHCPKNNCPYTVLGHIKKRHWWLTIFKMGAFIKPDKLFANISVSFKDYPMMYSFLDSFKKTLPDNTYKISGLTVYFTFSKSRRRYSLFKKIIRQTGLMLCHVYCKWFNYLTRPFSNTRDKILYLYYYLPFMIRHLLKSDKK